MLRRNHFTNTISVTDGEISLWQRHGAKCGLSRRHQRLGALEQLYESGFLLIVATNQPDVARGLQRREVVEAMHRQLREQLPLDDIKVCYEEETPASVCYKPKPGMLLETAREHAIDLSSSYMVGETGGATLGVVGPRVVYDLY